MRNQSYAARTKMPTGVDIDRIVNAVIAEAKHAQQLGHPDFNIAIPPGLITKNMARAIKRRLCQLIDVEVDLVVTGTTCDTGSTPSSAAMHASFRFPILTPQHVFGSLPGPI